jgi:hypothetical protein
LIGAPKTQETSTELERLETGDAKEGEKKVVLVEKDENEEKRRRTVKKLDIPRRNFGGRRRWEISLARKALLLFC